MVETWIAVLPSGLNETTCTYTIYFVCVISYHACVSDDHMLLSYSFCYQIPMRGPWPPDRLWVIFWPQSCHYSWIVLVISLARQIAMLGDSISMSIESPFRLNSTCFVAVHETGWWNNKFMLVEQTISVGLRTHEQARCWVSFFCWM